jgi:hypothetical protein
MDRAWLQRLLAEGAIEQCPRDPVWVERVLVDARLDLEWARRKLAEEHLAHPAGAAADGWEAALKAIQGYLNLARLRLTDRPGHHVAALNAASALLDAPWEPLLRRLRDLRRARRSGVYEVGEPPDVEVLDLYLDDVQTLIDHLELTLRRATESLEPR